MSDLLTSLVLGAAAFAAFLWIKGKWRDEALTAELRAMHGRATAELAPDDLRRLEAQIVEIGEVSVQAVRQGVPKGRADRAAKQAAIQQIAAFLEIERMFAPPQTR
jgi:hypothetical protein